MKILVFLTAILVSLGAFPTQVEDNTHQSFSINKPVTINWSLLQQFLNKTGETFGQAQLNSVITLINNASNIWGADIANNLKYIKAVMDGIYGDLNNQYSIVLQTVPTRDFGGATIYCQNGTNYAYIGYGTNLRYPSWTYLVYKVYAPGSSYNFLNYAYGRGSGLTADQADKITSTIRSTDGPFACSCSNIHAVSAEVENVLKGSWNVVCQSTQGIYSNVAILKSTWIMLKPQTCIYFIYAI